jgi:glucose-1-phosphate cytidylyltransferase
MVEVGGMPILWHIMKLYDRHQIADFVLALGYKGEIIKDYFLHYHQRMSDITVKLASGKVTYANASAEDWSVSMVDTGLHTMTGGRLLRLEHLLRPHGTFMLTYGDGVADIDLTALLAFHRAHGRLATVTAVRPAARFGTMLFDGDRVAEFREKPQIGEGWINGGFFVFESGVFDYIDSDATILEETPLERLSEDGQLMSFRHEGFWQCMDTLRDRDYLDGEWVRGTAKWKVWEDS